MAQDAPTDPNFYRHLRAELSDGWRWVDRAIVLAYGAAAGLVVVGFTLLSLLAHAFYVELRARFSPWLMLAWTPLVTVATVWLTRRLAPMAAGSGIPQVVAALDSGLDERGRRHFVSLKLSLAKVLLSAAGLVGGLSVGREGPSVQVAAGVMLHCQRWMRRRRRAAVTPHMLLVAGGAAGIAAAFNAPLAGVVFAIEELSRKFEARYSGVLIAAIVLGGLMGVSAFGGGAYFGTVTVPPLGLRHVLPAALVALLSGLAGGLFAKLLLVSLEGRSPDALSALRRERPLAFAALAGFAIALLALVSGGLTAGSGTEAARELLQGEQGAHGALLFAPLKFIATWLTAWSGVPGGLFAPSLSVGAGLGYDVAMLTEGQANSALIAMGMAAFLAAVTQAPLTAFIIVMEMIDGRPMVLSLMAVAMVAAAISRMISLPLYETLAARMLAAFNGSAQPAPPASAEPSPAAATAAPAPTSPPSPPAAPRP